MKLMQNLRRICLTELMQTDKQKWKKVLSSNKVFNVVTD